MSTDRREATGQRPEEVAPSPHARTASFLESSSSGLLPLASSLFTRRQLLGNMAAALGGIALGSLLGEFSAAVAATSTAAESHPLQFAPKAKRVLQIFCPGGVSHIDLLEHKPALEKYDGKPLPGEENLVSFQGKNGNRSCVPLGLFARVASRGKMISDLLPALGRHVDQMAFIHSMTSKTNTHGPACVFMNTGFSADGFPSNGAWASYALGSENDNLPTFIAITDIRGEPPSGEANWSNGFLPAQHQGIVLTAQQPMRNLRRPADISADAEAATRRFLADANSRLAERHPGESELQARVAAYELAGRMQLVGPRGVRSRPRNRPPSIGTMAPTIPIR